MTFRLASGTVGVVGIEFALIRLFSVWTVGFALATWSCKRADTEQGVAMGLNNSFNSLGRIVGPIWAGFAFDVNYSLPYLSGAAILVTGFVISLMWLPGQEEAVRAGVRSGV